MRATLRDFLKYTGAAGLAIASHDLVAELIAQSPKGNPRTSMFKGLSDIALGEAKKAGCTYADIRFTRSVTSGVNASGGSDRNADGGFGGGRGGAGRRGGARAGGRPGAAGFGVRVVHSGVWGFASSPIVTEDEIRRITRIAADIAKASAIAKKTDVKLAPVPAYIEYWSTPVRKDPSAVPQDEKQAFVQKVVDAVVKNTDVANVTASVGVSNE